LVENPAQSSSRRNIGQQVRTSGRGSEGGPPRGINASVTFYETKPFLLRSFRWNAGNVHVDGHGRRDVALLATGGLQALEFVQGLVEASLYRGLVAGELREGVSLQGVLHKAQAKPGGKVGASSEALVNSQARFSLNVAVEFELPPLTRNLYHLILVLYKPCTTVGGTVAAKPGGKSYRVVDAPTRGASRPP
jgi:hypothetical protein